MQAMWLVLIFISIFSFGTVICAFHNYSLDLDNQTIGQAFPLLENLAPKPPSSLPLSLGGQNFAHCCLLTVNESLFVVDGLLTLQPTSESISFSTNLNGLRDGQFLCEATYIGDKGGAPILRVSYKHCKDTCSGWQISRNTPLNQWVGPLVGFLVPAVIFALAIPRRRKVYISDALFDVPLNEVGSLPRTLYMVPVSALLAAIDTVLWLMTTFALAGPILLSGMYEAVLDSRILAYVGEVIKYGRLSTAQRAHFLFIVLVGNLDMDLGPTSEKDETSAWQDVDGPDGLLSGLRRVTRVETGRKPSGLHSQPGAVSLNGETAVSRDGHLGVSKAPETASDIELSSMSGQSGQSKLEAQKSESITIDPGAVSEAETHLRTMLAAQYSFGVTVGAPVVFFCGAFIYTLIENYSNLGDNNVSHALAFGMWWMTIPHIAIVSSFLLAGNNPNILEGVVGHPTVAKRPLKWRMLTFTYESRYRPAWIWDRGRSKRMWAQRLSKQRTLAGEIFGEEIRMSGGDWLLVAFMAYVLILIPSVLAFVTSYYTPIVGLSCRSMTFLLYMLSQLWLIILWVWDIESTNFEQEDRHFPFTRHAWNPPAWSSWIWYVQVILNVAVATFTAIGGTMMQIMGVYRNCLCRLPMIYWHDPDDQMTQFSSNSERDIYYASHTWTGTGSGAIAFLGCAAFGGWWYQKRLRHQFKLIVKKIGDRAEDHREIPPEQQQFWVPWGLVP